MKKSNIKRVEKRQEQCIESFDFYNQGNSYKKILNSGSKLSNCEFDSCLRNFDEDTLITI